MKKVSAKAVNLAGGDWQKQIELWGENNLTTQRAFQKYMELKALWEKQNGKIFGRMKKNSLAAGYSRATVSANIAEMVRAGRKPAQAAAGAYRAARTAFRKRFPRKALPKWLRQRKSIRSPRRNPAGVRVPANVMKQAGRLFEDFTGHELTHAKRIKAPVLPKVLVRIGTVDGVLYTTIRDGKTERYIHEFKRKARPTFAVSPDGNQLFLLGGAYSFTERGIVDKR